MALNRRLLRPLCLPVPPHAHDSLVDAQHHLLEIGTRDRVRTCDLRCVRPPLYQLSYPSVKLVLTGGFEPPVTGL
jgi:hypothetical protein